jgi:2-C-methyl-D-erythritol 4-phosphate cytidylyltransferase/2-C-methyl-D-erythritol 2,4-cyclodiphosphate synthase
MTAVALIVAAGSAQRFGGELPKQYRTLAGIPVLRHAILAFAHHPGVDNVALVIRPQDQKLYDQATAGLDLLPVTFGGDTRQASVLRGLEALRSNPPEHVLIHDAARPFVTHAVIDRVLDGLKSAPGCCAGIRVADSLKRTAGGTVIEDVPRDDLWRAQTPQGFRYQDIYDAHHRTDSDHYTDDVGVARAAGLAVTMVEGAESNFKITTSDDLTRAERLLASSMADIRIGQGYDVHRFADGDTVRLCGVDIPHTHRLSGHSDADVALHALTDAMLGAIGDGDIGQHFPPSDAKWRGADSAVFVQHALARIHASGGMLAHVDVTIICEAPKVSPHRDAMRARLAELLDLELSRVSVKATTTEGLGFTGRREGIAAQAIATVRLAG